MNVAYLQPPYPDSETYSPKSTFAWILQEMTAIKNETDFIVLPEYSNCPGINDYDDLLNFIRYDSKDFLSDLTEIAHDKSTFIAANITREVPNGLQNVTVLLDREGSVVAEYQKVHLTEFEQKALHIISGDKVQIVEIENIRVAFATCFDIYFADYFAAIARQNPDIIIFPSYQRSEKRRVILAQTAARAMDTGAFIVRSSYSRGEKSQTGGMSMIVHPNGEIVSNAEQHVGTFYVEIDPCEKWMRPKSFGQPAVSAREIVKIHQRSGVYMSEKVLSSNSSLMIKQITREIVWNGRKTGKTWFHPRATRLPDGSVLMNCQDITGFDSFGSGFWSKTTDNGASWSEPKPIAAFGRIDIGSGYEEGACDFVPEYHAPTGKVLSIGDSAYYKRTKSTFDQFNQNYNSSYTDPPEGFAARHPVYCVGDGSGNWGVRRELIWDDPRASRCNLCGCAQRVTLENGDILLPVYFASKGEIQPADHRYECSATTLRCSFNGEILNVEEVGRELRLPPPDGFMEPSVTRYKSTFYLTLRAWENNLGYVTTSSDGLNWNDIQPWKFDSGETVDLSPTQQRWLKHSDGLFLVYTRKTEDNYNVFWWRAPLFVAQVDTEKMCLIRDMERIVFPMDEDGTAKENKVACMGNFHVTNVSPYESWVTVGEGRRHDLTRGDTLLGRIYWDKPNRLV